jgi:hypothetical protein
MYFFSPCHVMPISYYSNLVLLFWFFVYITVGAGSFSTGACSCSPLKPPLLAPRECSRPRTPPSLLLSEAPLYAPRTPGRLDRTLGRLDAACPCRCFSFYVDATCPCPCCISLSMLLSISGIYVHVRAACPCTCCMSMSMLHDHVNAA